MCGICGQYNFTERVPVRRADVERMATSIAHRGPDDEGYYLSGPVGLGFRRLSIIDLAGGHQPMSDQEESVWVVFNGEIYNFPELRRELEGLGHKFRTNSDTEVIIHGYKHWGDDVFNHLNGMFGLAIWDAREERLILARDRFGMKMIYYRVDAGRLYFGSEMRAVLAATGERGEVNPAALNLFLRYRYTPAPHTIFLGISKLAPGTMLVCEKKSVQVKRWYQYRPTPFVPAKSVAQVQDELLELYKQSMKRHLLSDVPVGLLLSGGVDSGMLLALMNLYGDRWRTYTVGYGNSFVDDELRDAAATAAHFSSQHTEVMLDRAIFEKALPSIVSCLEEPIASSSIVPMYFVCQRAREDVKVALIGQGPDELFGGYRRHLGVRYGSWWGDMPAWMRHTATRAIARLPRNETLKRATYSLDVSDRMQRYQQVLSLLPGDQVDDLFQDGLLARETGDAILDCWADLSPLMEETDELGGFQFVEMRSTLSDELLMFADKLSMAHGLEARVPYLDKELVEYVERLPAQFKVRNGSRKWIHRRVCAEFLPKEFMRRKKRGFAVNVTDDWFRSAIGGVMEESILDSDSLMYRFLRPVAVREMLRRHKAGKGDFHKILFSLGLFEQWLRVQAESAGAVEHEAVSSC
jgi:asparagine synthase (glutamine-hydrolysing)